MTVVFVGAKGSSQKSKLRFIHDSATNVGIFEDKNIWWQEGKDELGSQPEVAKLLKPIFDLVSQEFANNGVTPIVSRGVEAGRPVFVLKAKGMNGFRAVIDQKTRAVRSFELADAFSIRGFDQSFDEPLADAAFLWTPPADTKQVEQSEAMALLPEFLKAFSRKPAATSLDKTMMKN